jgi:glycosyltransferase involved in cell wall biosynthesis
MACGVPCLGSDAVGIPEAVRTGETGILVPPGDPTALADAIQRVARDPSLRHRMGEQASAWVRAGFSRSACMDRLAETLHRTSTNRPSSNCPSVA